MHASMPNLGGQMEADNHPQPNTGAIGDGNDGVPYALLLHLPKEGLRGGCVLLEGGRLVVVGQCATKAVSHPHLLYLPLFPAS